MLSRVLKKIKYILPVLLSAALIFTQNVKAAPMSNIYISPGGSNTALLVNQYVNTSGKSIAVYEYSVSVRCTCPTNAYVSGYQYATCVLGYSVPPGYTSAGISCSMDGLETSNMYSAIWNFDNGSNRPVIGVYFDNYFTDTQTSIPLGIVTCRWEFDYTGSGDPKSYLELNPYTGGTNGDCWASNVVNEKGKYQVIFEAIYDVLTNITISTSDTVAQQQLTALYSLLNTNVPNIIDALQDIALSLENIEDFETYLSMISTISGKLDNLYSRVNLIYYNTDNMVTYLNLLMNDVLKIKDYLYYDDTYAPHQNNNVYRILDILRQVRQGLFEMNTQEASQVAAIESEYNALESKQAEQNAILEAVNRPTFSSGQFDSNDMVDTGQKSNFTGLLSMIVGNGYITRIFIIVLTFATAGFVLFGKKG